MDEKREDMDTSLEESINTNWDMESIALQNTGIKPKKNGQ